MHLKEKFKLFLPNWIKTEMSLTSNVIINLIIIIIIIIIIIR